MYCHLYRVGKIVLCWQWQFLFLYLRRYLSHWQVVVFLETFQHLNLTMTKRLPKYCCCRTRHTNYIGLLLRRDAIHRILDVIESGLFSFHTACSTTFDELLCHGSGPVVHYSEKNICIFDDDLNTSVSYQANSLFDNDRVCISRADRGGMMTVTESLSQ